MRGNGASFRQVALKFLAIIILSVLAGCATYKPKPISPGDNAAQLEARRLDDAGLKNFLEQNSGGELKNWPLKSWDLDSLTLAAFYFQPNLAVARAQWREAAGGIKTAAGRPNPTVTVGPGYNFSALDGVNPWSPFGSIDVPIETAGKRGKRISQAEHLAESARQNYFSAAWQSRANVRAGLVEFIVARERAARVEEQFSAQQEISSRLEQRLAVGAISRADVTVSRVALAKAQIDLSDAQAKRAAARVNLAQAVGVPVAAFGVPPSGGNTPPTRPPEGGTPNLVFDLARPAMSDLTSADARRVALCGRADVRAALADYAAAEDSLRLEIAKQYPDLHLNPGYQFDQGDHKWTLGFTFELPVLNQNQGPIREADARRETAAAKFTALQAQVIGEIDRALDDYQAARGQMKTSAELFAAAQKQQQSARDGLKAGATDKVDVLNAQIEFAAAALARLDAQSRLQSAIGALENALQRPLAGDILSAGKFPTDKELKK